MSATRCSAWPPAARRASRRSSVYLAIYLVMTLGTFACILLMRRRGSHGREHLRPRRPVAQPADAGAWRWRSSCSRWPASRRSPASSASSTSSSPRSTPGSIVRPCSACWPRVVASYYYLRIVKVMYFDEPAAALDRPVVRRQPRRGLRRGRPAWRCSRWRRSRSAWSPPRRRRACSRELRARPAGRVAAGRARQRRQHQRRGRAPGRRRRARRHRRLGARADRRPRPPRPRLGLARRQSLHLDHPAARLPGGRAPPSWASSRRWPWPTSCRPAAPVAREMAERRAGRRRQGRRHPARERDRPDRRWCEHVVAGIGVNVGFAPAAAGDALSRRRRCGGSVEAALEMLDRGAGRDGSPTGAATASRRCARPGWPRPARSAPRSTCRLGERAGARPLRRPRPRGRAAAGDGGRSAPDRVGRIAGPRGLRRTRRCCSPSMSATPTSKFAVFDGDQHRRRSGALRTEAKRTADEYAVWLTQLMAAAGLRAAGRSRGAIIASVVPQATLQPAPPVRDATSNCEPLIVGEPDCRPRHQGADRPAAGGRRRPPGQRGRRRTCATAGR